MELEKIKLRLKSLGYEPTEADDFALDFVMKKTEQHIKHFCNISSIPDCLEYVFIDMAAGEFLQTKKSLGQLSIEQVEQITGTAEPAIKKIQDGDTTIEYQSVNTTAVDSTTLFNNLMDKLINGYETDLIRHRKLVW